MQNSIFTLIFALLFSTINLLAQDIHWAHIHASPTYLNPAMTGVIANGDVRFIANARSQWNDFTNGYKTTAASADLKLVQAGKSAFIGAGINTFADQAGDLDFTTLKAGLSFSAVKALDRNSKNLVSVGFQSDYIAQTIDFSKMVGFEEEPLVGQGTPNKIQNYDLSVGIGWYYAFTWHSSFYMGASLSHINRPDISFRSRALDSNEPSVLYDRKYVVHGGANLRLAKYVSILPSAMIAIQGPHREVNFGSYLKFKKDPSFKVTDRFFYIGAWLRPIWEGSSPGLDAFVFSLRMDKGSTAYTFSYDFNTSKLARASYLRGGPEISIIHTFSTDGPVKKNHKVKCPAF